MEKSLRGIYLLVGLAIVTVFVSIIAERKLSAYNEELSLFKSHPSVKTVEKELECLALNIYREAGNEPFEDGDKIIRDGKVINAVVPKKTETKLKIGDVLDVQLQAGDIISFNRQPFEKF